MADDTLRLVAKVTDEFTGPLGKLKKDLAGVGDETKKQGAHWRRDWAGAREEVDKFRGALDGFSPVLSAIGVGSFGAAMSLTGIATALKSFSGSTRDLSQMSRQIGMTVNDLRTFGALGDKFGVSAETMRSAIGHLADNAVDLRQRWGQVYGELRNMNLGKLAEDLVAAPNMKAMAERAMQGIQDMPDSMKAARVATLIFGTPDVATVVRNLGVKVGDALKQTQADIGSLDKTTEEAARRFEEHFSRIGRAAEKLKLKVLGPALGGIVGLIDDAEKNGLSGNEQEQDTRRQLSPFGSPEATPREKLEGRRTQVQQQLQLLEQKPHAADYQRKHDRMVEELKRVADELQRLRETGGTASVSPSSFGGSGALGGGNGSLIQKTAWGGLGASAGGGRSIPGYGSPSSGGGSSGGSGGSGGGARDVPDAPGIGGGMRGRPFGSNAPAGDERSVDTPRGTGRGNPRAARTGEMMRYATDQLRREGVPEANLRQAAAQLVGQATMESGLDPNKVHDRGTGYGIYGARDPSPGRGRRTDMLRWLKENGYAPNSAEGQMREMAHRAMSGAYPQTRKVLMGSGTGDVDHDTNTVTKEFESPAVINRRSGAVRNAFRAGPEQEVESGPAFPPKPPEAQGDGEPDADLSAQSTYRNGKIGKVEGFVFHHTGGRGTPQSVVETLNRRGLGVQYVMGRDGKVYRTLPEGARGAHILPSSRFPKAVTPGLSNENAEGMEVIANDDRDVTPAQVAAAKRFYADYAKRHPGVRAYGHGEINPGHKQATEGRTIADSVRREDQDRSAIAERDPNGDGIRQITPWRKVDGASAGRRPDRDPATMADDTGTGSGGDGIRQTTPWRKVDGASAGRRLDRAPATMAEGSEIPPGGNDVQTKRAPNRKVGDALMDRFYGKGAVSGGPGMQMPGAGAGGGKGKLDIHLHGFPQGAQARASLDDLFKETNVSKGRSQMDMGRA